MGNHGDWVIPHPPNRIVELEGEVSAASERVGQLLVEKEKALADLKTIRKTNRTMEK